MKILRPFCFLCCPIVLCVVLGTAFSGCSFLSDTSDDLLGSHVSSSALKKEAPPADVPKFKGLSLLSQSEHLRRYDNLAIKISSKYAPTQLWPVKKPLAEFRNAQGRELILLFASNLGGLYAVWADSQVTLLLRANSAKYAVSSDFASVAQARLARIEIFSLAELLAASTKPAARYEINRMDTEVLELDFHEQNQAIAFIAADGRLYRWRFVFEQELSRELILERGKSLEIYPVSSNLLSTLALHPSGRVLTVGDWGGRLTFVLPYTSDRFQGGYDTNLFGPNFFIDKSVRRSIARADNSHVKFIKYGQQGLNMAVASEAGNVEIYTVRGLSLTAKLEKAHRGQIRGFDVSPDFKQIASCGRDGLLKIFTVKAENEGQERLSLKFEQELPECYGLNFISEDVLLLSQIGRISALNLSNLSVKKEL